MADDRVALARQRQSAAVSKAVRARMGPPLDLSDAELDAMVEITAADQKRAAAHAARFAVPRLNALLEAEDDTTETGRAGGDVLD